jgi:hypothetical protein
VSTMKSVKVELYSTTEQPPRWSKMRAAAIVITEGMTAQEIKGILAEVEERTHAAFGRI